MGDTKIQWATKVWNPITGCSPISAGCDHCYAARMANRLRGRCGYPADEPFRVTLHPEKLHELLHWKKPQRIFVNSMGDLFHEDVPREFIDKVFGLMAACKQHTFILLTKRPQRALKYYSEQANYWHICKYAFEYLGKEAPINGFTRPDMLKNVWFGVTVENQEMANLRIPILLQIHAAVRFVSIEPMLGPITLCGPDLYIEKLDWVICGGETGPNARPMHPDWIRSLRDQCKVAGIPFFFKQWGEWAPIRRNNDTNQIYVGDGLFVTAKKFASLDKQGRDVLDLPGLWNVGDVDMAFVGKKVAGDLLDGKQFHQFPKVSKRRGRGFKEWAI